MHPDELTCEMDGVCSVCGLKAHDPKPVVSDRCMRQCLVCGARYYGPPRHYGLNGWCVNPAEPV